MEGTSLHVPIYSKKTQCIFCRCKIGKRTSGKVKKAYHLNKETRISIWNNQKVLISKDHKCCTSCYSNGVFQINEIQLLDLTSNPHLAKDLIDLINQKSQEEAEKVPTQERTWEGINYDCLSSKQCEEACGLTAQILEELALLIDEPPNHLFEFFMICKQGLSQRFTGVLVSCSQPNISYWFNKILKKLASIFVPLYLGPSAFTREKIKMEHTPKMWKEIWPSIIGVLDGTYIYCEKSNNFEVQRETFSGQKKQNLFKFMAIVLPDGTILDFIGPFGGDGDHSDEWIWEYILKNNEDLIKLFQKDDEFLADRGFLRIVDGFKLNCPIGLKPKEKQLQAEDANNSRLVTCFRNIVERVFGRLKMNWKILYNKLDANYFPLLEDIAKVLCAAENAYYDRIWKDKDSDESDIKSLKSRNLKVNSLCDISKGWKKIASLAEFKVLCPQYSLDILREWTIGPYALELSKRYLDHSPDIEFKYHPKHSKTFKISKIISRFSKHSGKSPKKYSVILQIPEEGDIEDIKSYCTCKTGARTLGGCAHATAMLYLLTVPQEDTSKKRNSPTSESKGRKYKKIGSFKRQLIEERKAKGLVIQEDVEENQESD